MLYHHFPVLCAPSFICPSFAHKMNSYTILCMLHYICFLFVDSTIPLLRTNTHFFFIIIACANANGVSLFFRFFFLYVCFGDGRVVLKHLITSAVEYTLHNRFGFLAHSIRIRVYSHTTLGFGWVGFWLALSNLFNSLLRHSICTMKFHFTYVIWTIV